MVMFSVDIAAEARANTAFRRVLHTTGHVQVVVMCLQPGEDIGAEVHEHNDQVLTFVTGSVNAEVAGDARRVGVGDMVCLSEVSKSGTTFSLADIAAGPSLGRYYGKVVCPPATEANFSGLGTTW